MPTNNMTDFKDIFYQSSDGLSLYARQYEVSAENAARPTLLCMHGLTRNSADFEGFASIFKDSFPIVAVDQRGRGRSAYDSNSANYSPAIYVEDMMTLIDTLQLESIILVGTSMGGLMAMMMAATGDARIKGLVINDIGPEVAPEGLARIQSYVGKTKVVSSWQEAADQAKQINCAAFPDYTEQDWMAFAKRTYTENKEGVPVLAYDAAIAQPIDASEGQSLSLDLWPLFDLIVDYPMLVVRGELSDILAPDCVQKMQYKKPNLDVVDVPQVGHAPFLDEASVQPKLKKFFDALL